MTELTERHEKTLWMDSGEYIELRVDFDPNDDSPYRLSLTSEHGRFLTEADVRALVKQLKDLQARRKAELA